MEIPSCYCHIKSTLQKSRQWWFRKVWISNMAMVTPPFNRWSSYLQLLNVDFPAITTLEGFEELTTHQLWPTGLDSNLRQISWFLIPIHRPWRHLRLCHRRRPLGRFHVFCCFLEKKTHSKKKWNHVEPICWIQLMLKSCHHEHFKRRFCSRNHVLVWWFTPPGNRKFTGISSPTEGFRKKIPFHGLSQRQKQPLHVWQIHGDLSADSGHPTCIPAGAAQACTHWSWAYIQVGPPVVLDILYRLYRLNNHGNENSKTTRLWIFMINFMIRFFRLHFFSPMFPCETSSSHCPLLASDGISPWKLLEKRRRIIEEIGQKNTTPMAVENLDS